MVSHANVSSRSNKFCNDSVICRENWCKHHNIKSHFDKTFHLTPISN
jgi:hypothetical protein